MCRVEILIIRKGEGVVSMTSGPRAEWSRIRRRTTTCRDVEDSRGVCRAVKGNSSFQIIRYDELKSRTFRNVRLARRNEQPGLRWMRTCGVRECFVVANRGLRNRDLRSRDELRRVKQQLPRR